MPAALAADWLTSAWDQNAGLYAISPAASVAEEVAAGLARRAARPAGRDERRVRDRRDDGQLHGPRGRSARRPRRTWAGTSNGGACRAPRTSRSSPTRDPRHGLRLAPDARHGPGRRARPGRGRGRPGPDAPGGPRRRAGDDRRPGHRLRPGRQREHRCLRPVRDDRPDRARARRVGPHRWRVRDLGGGRAVAAAPDGAATSRPIPGRPTRTSGSTCHTTRGSSSSATRRPTMPRRRSGAAYYVETEGGERDPYNWVPESSRRARGFTRAGRAPLDWAGPGSST